MGLYQSRFAFSGPPADPAAIRAKAQRRLGDLDGLESVVVEGQTVIVQSMLDPFTHPVLCAILQEMGGQRDGVRDGSRILEPVPAWASRPIQELSCVQRVVIRLRWWCSLIGRGVPR